MGRIKTTIFYLSFWLLIAGSIPPLSRSSDLPQENQTSTSAARKIDEYRIRDMRGHDEQMRLWAAFDDFAQASEDARLVIIAYGDLPGRGRRHANRAKNYLVNNHGVNPARIVTIDGGFRTETSVEIWIVPAGAQLPTPSPSGTFERNINASWKYDEFSLDGWWFGDYGDCCERQPEGLDGFAAALRANPQTTGYIVVHRGTIWCETCLRPGTELRFARRERDYLIRTHRISPSRIRIISAGRGGGKMQLWVVPSGATLTRLQYSLRSQR